MIEKPAFSRPLAVHDVPAAGLATSVTASEAECAGVAAELGLPAIAELAATFKIAPAAGGRFEVRGEVTAAITQICVVSLDPFDSTIRQPIEVTFASVERPMLQERHSRRLGEDRKRGRAAPPPPAPVAAPAEGEEDPPDPIVDGRIDLGTVAVEFLTLSLDLYPRKPGVAFDDVTLGEDEAPIPSAFAALERLKDRS